MVVVSFINIKINGNIKSKWKNVKSIADKRTDGDVSSAIRNTLSASLNNGTHNGLNSLSGDSASLQNQLVASSKLALISPVDYEEVNSFNNSVQDLKSKYIVLKPQSSSGSNASSTITSNSSSVNGKSLVNGSATDKTGNGTGNIVIYLFNFFSLISHYFIYMLRIVHHFHFYVSRSLTLSLSPSASISFHSRHRICFMPCSYSFICSYALSFSAMLKKCAIVLIIPSCFASMMACDFFRAIFMSAAFPPLSERLVSW